MAAPTASNSVSVIQFWEQVVERLQGLCVNGLRERQNNDDADLNSFNKICAANYSRKSQIFEESTVHQEHEKYFTKVFVMIANVIVNNPQRVSSKVYQVERVVETIVKFLIQQIKRGSSPILTKSESIQIIESLYHLKQHYPAELLQRVFDTEVETPKHLIGQLIVYVLDQTNMQQLYEYVDNKEKYSPFRENEEDHPNFKKRIQLSVMTSFYGETAGMTCLEVLSSSKVLIETEQNYKILFESASPKELVLTCDSIRKITEELSMVKGIFSMPILTPFKETAIDKMKAILRMSLKAALFVASGFYKIKKEETENENGISVEEFCRKHGLRATEESLSIFDEMLKLLSNVSRISTSVSLNIQVYSSIIILKGLVKIAKNACIDWITDNAWKWFDGVNIMIITMISRVMTIVSSLIEELQEDMTLLDATDKEEMDENSDLLKAYTPANRLRGVLRSVDFPTLFLDIYLQTYRKGVQISLMIKEEEEKETEEAKKLIQENADEEKKDGSEEDSNEEGSMLGNLFQASPSIEEKSTVDDVSEKERRSEDAFRQSGEIFSLLASSILEFMHKVFPICGMVGFEDTVKNSLTPEKLKEMALVLVKEENNEMVKFMTKLLSGFVVNNYVNDEQLDAMLLQWDISPNSTSRWPLRLSHHVLVVFSRIILTRYVIDIKKFHEYTCHAIKSFANSLRRAVQEENTTYSNVNYIQALLLFYKLLDEPSRVEMFAQFKEEFERVSDGDVVSPIHACRMILLMNHFLRSTFTGDTAFFSKQVRQNILSDDSGCARSTYSYFQAAYEESEIIFKAYGKDERESEWLSDKNPLYFMLAPDCKKAEDQILNLISAEKGGYERFYSQFMELTRKILTKLEKERDIFYIVAYRHAFHLLWNMARQLPIPVTYLMESERTLSDKDTLGRNLFYLCWIPQIYELTSLSDVEKVIKVFYEDVQFSPDKEFMDKIHDVLPKLSTDPSCILNFSNKLISKASKMILNGEYSLSSYMSADGMLVFSWLLLKKYVMDPKDNMYSVEALKSIFMSAVTLLQNSVKESKKLIINWASNGDNISDEKMEFYIDVLGVDLPELSNCVDIVGSNTVIPEKFLQALKGWNKLEIKSSKDIIPSLLESIHVNYGSSNPHISSLIALTIGGLITTHMDISTYEPPFMTAGASLKRCITTLASICKDFIQWMPLNMGSEFDTLKENCSTIFGSLLSDNVAKHVAEDLEVISKACSTDSKADNKFEMHFIGMLSIIDKWFLREIELGITEDIVLVNWLQFMNNLMDHSKTLDIFLNYFNGRSESISKIFMSAVNIPMENAYRAAYMNFFMRIMNLGEAVAGSNILKAILKIFDMDASTFGAWLKGASLSGDQVEDGWTMTKLLIKHGIDKSCSMESCLFGVVEVAFEMVDEMANGTFESSPPPSSIQFSQFFDVIRMLLPNCESKCHKELLQRSLDSMQRNKSIWIEHVLNQSQTSPHFNRIEDCCSTFLNYFTKLIQAIVEVKKIDGGTDSIPHHLYYGDNEDGDDYAEDEEDGDEEKEDDDASKQICTFTITKHEFMNQHWYHCHTCKMSDGVGCCSVCAKICHKGHDVTYSKHGSFFCDCGAKEDGSCMAMPKTLNATSATSAGEKSSPFATWGDPVSSVSSRPKRLKRLLCDETDSHENKNDEWICLFRKIDQETAAELEKTIRCSEVFEFFIALLNKVTKEFESEVDTLKERRKNDKEETKKQLELLYTQDKRCSTNEQLMVTVSGSQEGAFENIKLNFSGDQGQSLRRLMNYQVLQHKALCLLVSQNGKKQQLAVAHDKGKITILQLSGLLKQSEKGKIVTLNRLSSITTPFTVLHLACNQINDDFIAVTGTKDCHVLVLGPSGNMLNRLAVSVKLETGNYIIKPIWVPGSQTKLAIVTADFVKIYELSKSETEPTHHFILPSGKVRDVTFVPNDNSINIVVMSSPGYIYTEVLSNESSADPFFMMNVLPVEHRSIDDSEPGMLNGGGSSIFYSRLMKVLFFSYSKGQSFMAVFNKGLSGFDKVFSIITSFASPLVQWDEVPGQLGLIHCHVQNSNNVIVLAVKTDKILIQELKSPSKNVKVQNAVCYYNPTGKNPQGTDQTTLVMLLDDGSLRIYNSHSDFVRFEPPKVVLSPRDQPVKTPTVKKVKSSRTKTKKSASNKFPVDFFEHCQNTTEIEFSGVDILHVYTRAQVKHRLNTAGMYIANTKPSGFKMEVKNTNTDNIIVGIRVQVGVQSTDRSPQYFEILGRITQMKMAKNRWFDVPFTREESMQIATKNNFQIIFGASSDPNGLSIVDSIKVYVQSKSDFGYKEEKAAEKTKVDFESVMIEEKCPTFNSETFLLSALSAVNVALNVFDVRSRPVLSANLLMIASQLLTAEAYFNSSNARLTARAHILLHNLFPDENKFLDKKDEINTTYFLNEFENVREEAGKCDGMVDADLFLSLLSIAVSVGTKKPENFVRFLKATTSTKVFVENILQYFWDVHKLTETSELQNRGLQKLGQMAEKIVQILFILMLGDQNEMENMTNHISHLLLHKDHPISFAAKQGLMKILQCRLKPSEKLNATSLEKTEQTLREIETPGPSDQESTQHAPSTEPLAQQQPPENIEVAEDLEEIVDIQVIEGDDGPEDMDLDDDEDDDEEGDEGHGGIDIENELMNNGDLQMLLEDDNAMMELALALSLQNPPPNAPGGDQEGSNGGEGDGDAGQPQAILMPDDGYDNFAEDADDADTAEDDGIDDEEEDDYDEFQEEITFPDDQPETTPAPEDADGDASDNGLDSYPATPSFSESSGLIGKTTSEPTDSAFNAVWLHLIHYFQGKIDDLVLLDGLHAIPFLQVLLILCSNLGDTEEDKKILENVVQACIKPLKIDQLEGEDVAKRSETSEVQLVLMRFLSVLMSRYSAPKKSSEKKKKDVQEIACPEKIFDTNVANALCSHSFIEHCLFLMKSLQSYWEQSKTMEDVDTSNSDSNESSALLKPKSLYPIPDMMPFFMEQYVKSHALDLFEAFPQLVTEMTLRVPYQIHKLLDGKDEENLFSKDWTYILCEYMLMPHTPFVRKQVRKLLLALCGSKEKYRYVKDLHNLRSHLSNLKQLFQHTGMLVQEGHSNTSLSYEDTVSLTENISACIDIASAREDNWQSFCRKEKAILPFLIQTSYQVNEHLSSKIIELISQALISKKTESKEKKEKNTKDLSLDLVKQVFIQCNGNTLTSFIRTFLLESNSSVLRWKVHELIHTIFLNISSEQQVDLIKQMWSLWDKVPLYGHRGTQFIDLLGYFTIKATDPSIQETIASFTAKTISTLKERNRVFNEHPNSNLYRKLSNYIQLDGFYLESDPCMICNNPELTYNTCKLSTIKSDIRYTTKAQVVVKLTGNFSISKVNIKITDIKRAKMVKTIIVYYSNKTVPSAIELKNRTEIWQRAKKLSLTQGQNEVKVDLAFPITACNLMIEFAEFYDNVQFSSETLQCPRCSASVPAHPGVCSNCGENVYQCHKCRAINYDEKDPFLCTSCGFCKYAKFEFSFNAQSTCSVESINTEEDREKALKSVNSTLEKADQYYKQLSGHRFHLESLLKKAGTNSKGDTLGGFKPSSNVVWNVSALNPAPNSSSSSSSNNNTVSCINNAIQGIAQRYCVDCKSSFEEMSKVTQLVTATRKELANYDMKQQETLSQVFRSSPGVSPSTYGQKPSFTNVPAWSSSSEIVFDSERKDQSKTISKCFGCTLSCIQHCLTILRAFVTVKSTHGLMMKEGLLQELVENNLQQQSTEIVSLAETVLMNLTSDNKIANNELSNIIVERIKLCLMTHASNMSSNISLRSELSVLRKSINSGDYVWEERIRCVFRLFLHSMRNSTPEVLESISLPCLEIISNCLRYTKETRLVVPVDKNVKPIPQVDALKWVKGVTDDSFKLWKIKNKHRERTPDEYLMQKYGSIWLQKTGKLPVISDDDSPIDFASKSGWLRVLVFASSSRQTRSLICSVLENLAKYPDKRKKILHLLTSYLEELHTAGETAAEYLHLFKLLLLKSEWRMYLCDCGILDTLAQLLIKEVNYLGELESSISNFDIAQGYALNALADLMRSLLEDEEIRKKYGGLYVAEVLQCYLALRKLVVQRTKLVDETQEILSSLLQEITSGTEESTLMKTSIDALRRCPFRDIRTPAFIFEQLCDVIHKEEEQTTEFFMFLEKDLQQEDYLQGRMQGNPYSSKEPGLGPLMRDVKNKICTECELVALLEDDTGMELLVHNKIISLELPVDQVYKKIWCNGGNDSKDPMKIVYRMRGLLGDATEDMIENLDNGKEKDINEEDEYQRATIMAEIGGLDLTLKRLSYIRDLSRAQQLVSAILKLLEFCVKVKVNRQYLHKPSVKTMDILLGTLNQALRLERDLGSNSGGAIIAERVLKLMEIILHEASSEADTTEVVVLPGEESQLELLLNHITSPYVRSNPNVLEAMMRLTPFLTFGREEAMSSLISYFSPYFNFDSFDQEKSPDAILHLDCFSMIANGISISASGSKLKDKFIAEGIVGNMLSYLHSHAPPKSFRASGILDSAKWNEFLAKPSLPYILRILTGLINGHEGTQTIFATDENVGLLHHLEQVSTEGMVGSLAENLFEALGKFPVGKKKIDEVREQTKEEKKRLAMAMRQKQLESLGMMMTNSGQIKAKPTSVSKEMESLMEEQDQRLVCCICREGYKFYPNKVLGIYTFTLRCVLDEFENKPKRTQGYTTVSHFNVIHYDCHLEAVRHARSRDEWESAALQNSNTKCNGLLPIWGPKVSESSFATCLARHNNYIQEYTGIREPTFHSSLHDLRLALLRFAQEKSFHRDAGGGGKRSNMYLLPYMIHISLYVLNTTRQRPSEEQLLKLFLDTKKDTWIVGCYEVNGPLFMTVLSIFVLSYEEWKAKKVVFLKRLILLGHVRNISPVPINTLANVEVKPYEVYKPYLLFFHLVDRFQRLCKEKLPEGEDWSQGLSNFLRNNDELILKEADKILKTFEEELLPCESFGEFCDVQELLTEIPHPDEFLKDIIKPYGVEATEVFC